MHAGRGWGEFLQRSASFIPSWAVLYKTVCCVGSDLLHDPIKVDIWIFIVARGAFDGLSEAQSGLRDRSRDDAITLVVVGQGEDERTAVAAIMPRTNAVAATPPRIVLALTLTSRLSGSSASAEPAAGMVQ